MKNNKQLLFQYIELDTIDDLDDDEKELLMRAKDAMKRAYAPYSKFSVGAALRLENGIIIEGNNQENASYPHGTCAEKVALNYAHAMYPNQKVLQMAVTASKLNGALLNPVTPCGGCRQSISEQENIQKDVIKIILQSDESKVYIIDTVKHLLPLTFTSSDLK